MDIKKKLKELDTVVNREDVRNLDQVQHCLNLLMEKADELFENKDAANNLLKYKFSVIKIKTKLNKEIKE